MAYVERSSLLFHVVGMVTWKNLEVHDSEASLSILSKNTRVAIETCSSSDPFAASYYL